MKIKSKKIIEVHPNWNDMILLTKNLAEISAVSKQMINEKVKYHPPVSIALHFLKSGKDFLLEKCTEVKVEYGKVTFSVIEDNGIKFESYKLDTLSWSITTLSKRKFYKDNLTHGYVERAGTGIFQVHRK